jgi:hypothetical protein
VKIETGLRKENYPEEGSVNKAAMKESGYERGRRKNSGRVQELNPGDISALVRQHAPVDC